MASFYAVYHGPVGLKTIASRVHRLTTILALGLKAKGVSLKHASWFDTLTVQTADKAALIAKAEGRGINLRADLDGAVGVSLSETTTRGDVAELFELFLGAGHGLDIEALDQAAQAHHAIPQGLLRTDAVLTHEVFNKYHSETEMLRYIHRLEAKDLALNYAMISLGSCTMKLNATAEMIPVTWPEFGKLHPFAPLAQAKGYQLLLADLENWLVKVTGYDAVCMQPNSGAQGEYAGLLAIKKYHESRGEGHRDICLIPASAHGTNPASAQMAGLRVIVTACDKSGNVDLDDLRAKAAEAGDQLSCLMVTYPSTHGVYEETIKEVCDIVHQHGGQVLPISWMYIAMLGDEGLKKSTQVAILNANYLAKKLGESFPVLYSGRNGRVAHECILDIRPLKEASGISEMDVAKRLMDYGFHAPTMSFPVAGTLMVEPTESESKRELDRFVEAMTAIRAEIAKVQDGQWSLTDNPLVHAPHTQDDVMDAEWSRGYSRAEAVFPSDAVRAAKLWPSVNRIDDVYGDRNLFCSCIPTEDYAK